MPDPLRFGFQLDCVNRENGGSVDDEDNSSEEEISDDNEKSGESDSDLAAAGVGGGGSPAVNVGFNVINDEGGFLGVSNLESVPIPNIEEVIKVTDNIPSFAKVGQVVPRVQKNKNKRKKSKGVNSLGQEVGSYSSSNDRPNKESRLEENDPFGPITWLLEILMKGQFYPRI
ncbi:hypothetical protein Hanom_Chr02g00122441 [Helianthus anomalus]